MKGHAGEFLIGTMPGDSLHQLYPPSIGQNPLTWPHLTAKEARRCGQFCAPEEKKICLVT